MNTKHKPTKNLAEDWIKHEAERQAKWAADNTVTNPKLEKPAKPSFEDGFPDDIETLPDGTRVMF